MSSLSILRERIRRWTFAGLFFGVATSLVILLILLRLDGPGGFVPAAFFGGIAIIAFTLGAAVLALLTGVVSHLLRRREAVPAGLQPVMLNVGAVPDRIG
jgi:hypothetical protein